MRCGNENNCVKYGSQYGCGGFIDYDESSQAYLINAEQDTGNRCSVTENLTLQRQQLTILEKILGDKQ